MTPADAKMKWCPMARVRDDLYRSSSSTQGSISIGMQQGSFTLPNNGMSDPVGTAAVNRDQSGNVRYECKCVAEQCMMWRRHTLDDDDGHCGLAGHALHGM